MMYISRSKERCVQLASYIIENNATVRNAAKKFGISKSTVHKDVTQTLKTTNKLMYCEDVEQFVENQQRYSLAENEQLRLMICSHEGERLGCIDLSYYDGRKAFVSILIFDLDNRRKGFAENALHLMIDYAKSLDLQTLYANILPENLPSISLFEKVRFVKENGSRFVRLL